MKKLNFITAALTSVALLFGSFGITSCSDSGDDDSSKKPVLADAITSVSLADNVTFTAGGALPTSEQFVVVARISGKSKTLTAEEFTVTTPEANSNSVEADGATTETLKISDAAENKHSETVEVTITLVSNTELTKNCEITITDNAVLSSISVTFAENVKKEYNIGDTFDSTGITVKATYSGDETEYNVDMSEVTVEGFDSSTAGTKKITFTYGDKKSTDKLTIKVVDPNAAVDLSSYYKTYFVASTSETTVGTADSWSSGAGFSKNDDGSYSLTTAALWGGADTGVCLAFGRLKGGLVGLYEYLVIKCDVTNFEAKSYAVKVPGTQNKETPVQDEWLHSTTTDGKTEIEIQVPVSAFDDLGSESQAALVFRGTAKDNRAAVIVKEFYLAAQADPLSRPVSSITIAPTTYSLKVGETVTIADVFTVTDSNLNDVTSSCTFTLTEDTTVASINGDVLKADKAGSVELTATYNTGDGTFSATATINVIEITNLVKSVTFLKYSGATTAAGGVTELQNESSTGIYGSEANGIWNLHIPSEGSSWGNWSSQLFFTLAADDGTSLFEKDSTYYVSVKVNSSADLSRCVVKLNELVEYFNKEEQSYSASEDTVISSTFTYTGDNKENCTLVFAFNTGNTTVNISDITISKVVTE
ncbi:MAG: bacterial Ig-like domain-containing protein [Spirochaetales bacterium]|nr:bacterial Ig-like domain-containing protein [Spirochaetales bacterium]